jgi:hypothetical protein
MANMNTATAMKPALLNELEGAQRTLMNYLERDDLTPAQRTEFTAQLELMGEHYGHVAQNTANPVVIRMVYADLEFLRGMGVDY